MGAGLATAMGSVFSLLVMLTHFFSKKNTLGIVKPAGLFFILRSICVTDFSTFLDYLAQRKVSDANGITMEICNGYLKTQAGYSFKTVEQNVCGIRHFLKYLRSTCLISDDFAEKNHKPLTLPVPDAVGWAVIDYIKNGRPDFYGTDFPHCIKNANGNILM